MCLLLQQRGSFHHITALDQRFNYSSWLLINICKGGNHSGLLLQHILSNPTTNKPGFSHSSKSDDFLESSQMNFLKGILQLLFQNVKLKFPGLDQTIPNPPTLWKIYNKLTILESGFVPF